MKQTPRTCGNVSFVMGKSKTLIGRLECSVWSHIHDVVVESVFLFILLVDVCIFSVGERYWIVVIENQRHTVFEMVKKLDCTPACFIEKKYLVKVEVQRGRC